MDNVRRGEGRREGKKEGKEKNQNGGEGVRCYFFPFFSRIGAPTITRHLSAVSGYKAPPHPAKPQTLTTTPSDLTNPWFKVAGGSLIADAPSLSRIE